MPQVPQWHDASGSSAGQGKLAGQRRTGSGSALEAVHDDALYKIQASVPICPTIGTEDPPTADVVAAAGPDTNADEYCMTEERR